MRTIFRLLKRLYWLAFLGLTLLRLARPSNNEDQPPAGRQHPSSPFPGPASSFRRQEESSPQDPGARQDEDQSPESPERRRFFTLVTAACGAGIAGIVATPVIAFIFSPLLKKTPDVWRDVGFVSDFTPSTTTKVTFEDPSPLPWAGISGQSAAWLRYNGNLTFTAFSINCTHLGCPVRWLPDARLFMCPCHGGVFYDNGDVAAGPPERPLVRHEVRVEDGKVQIRTRPLEITGNLLPGSEQKRPK